MSFIELPIRVFKNDVSALTNLGLPVKEENNEVIIINGSINRDFVIAFYSSSNKEICTLELGSGGDNALSIAMAYEELKREFTY